MDSKQLRTRILVSGLVMAVSGLAIIVLVLVSLLPLLFQSRTPFENGDVFVVTQNQTISLYMEDDKPPRVTSYRFTFFAEGANANHVSRDPDVDFTYSINAVFVNNIPVSGTFGRRVALIDLVPGTYTVAFDPWYDTGYFVWGNYVNIREAGVRLMVRLIVPTMIFYPSLVLFIVFLVRRSRLKKVEGAAR